MYRELAPWWHLLSAPSHYAHEAEFFRALLAGHGDRAVRTLLELGSGGGNNASHLKAHFEMTLVDRSAEMLAESRKLNPECRHEVGDMRTVRLERTFDAVFIHDAIMYMTHEVDLRAAMDTAFIHCDKGGITLFVPDHTCESFGETTRNGGSDGPDRGVRYLEWVHDPDPTGTTYAVDFAYLLRDADGETRVMHDRHTMGLFPRKAWMRLLQEAGFIARSVRDEYEREVFIGVKPADA
jgi:hypothetical protein